MAALRCPKVALCGLRVIKEFPDGPILEAYLLSHWYLHVEIYLEEILGHERIERLRCHVLNSHQP